MRKSVGNRGSHDNKNTETKLDEEFIKIMLEIENNYSFFNKHEKIRIEQWSKKLCEVTQNPTWQQNRNNYALLLLDCVIKRSLNDLFNKVPPEGYLPPLNKHIVKSRIASVEGKSNKATQNSSKIHKSKEKEPSKLVDHIFTPEKTETLLRSIENKNDLQTRYDLNQSYIPPQRYTISSEKIDIQIKNRQSKRRPLGTDQCAEIQEIIRLKAELELNKINLENLKHELEIKDVIIFQMNKKMNNIQNLNKHLQNDKMKFREFLKIIKKGLNDKSIIFLNQHLANKITKHIDETLCRTFESSPIKFNNEPPENYNTVSNRSEIPENNTATKQINFSGTKNYFKNFESTRSHKRVNSIGDDFITNPTHISIQRSQDFILEQVQNFSSKRSKSIASFQKTPQSIDLEQEIKYKFQINDKETSNFLDYLEKFQKDNDKLKKETEELLFKSSNLSCKMFKLIKYTSRVQKQKIK